MEPKLAEFIHLFNTARFYEAHEVLEELWLVTPDPIKDFYKGLIQCAVSFAHVQRNNPTGASALHERSSRLLRQYPDQYLGIDAGDLLKQCDEFFLTNSSQKFPVIKRV